jgi:hypothetical protein
MTLEEAITQARQGGYQVNGSDGVETYSSGAKSSCSVWTRQENDTSFLVATEATFLDPLFWHALGGALGWQGDTLPDFELDWDLIDESVHEEIAQSLLLKGIPTWLYYWHRFIDCLTAGKTPESFFESLP